MATAVDYDQDSAIDWTGSDRITCTVRDVTTYGDTDVVRSRTYVHTANGSSATNLVSQSQTSTDGLRTWQTRYRDGSTPVMTSSAVSYPGGGSRLVITAEPDGSWVEQSYASGRLISVTRKDSASSQVSQVTYGYDPHGRLWMLADARNGTTVYTYNNADQVLSTTAPALGTGEPAFVSSQQYDLEREGNGVKH